MSDSELLMGVIEVLTSEQEMKNIIITTVKNICSIKMGAKCAVGPFN